MDSKSWKIGIVGGSGWLGGAIASAILDAGIVPPTALSLSYRSNRPDRFTESFWTTENDVISDRSDVIILCVRPQDWPFLRFSAKGKLVISVMAGVRLSDLAAQLQTSCAVRSLPNAAAEVRKSFTPWIATAGVTDSDRKIIDAIFNACGLHAEVHSEAKIDYFTGLTGSGPAFPALLAEAMMNDAIARGIDQQTARRAVNAVFIGAGRLLEKYDSCPADTVRTFLDYRGTTAAGIEAMGASGFTNAVACGLAAASERSVQMGRLPRHLS